MVLHYLFWRIWTKAYVQHQLIWLVFGRVSKDYKFCCGCIINVCILCIIETSDTNQGVNIVRTCFWRISLIFFISLTWMIFSNNAKDAASSSMHSTRSKLRSLASVFTQHDTCLSLWLQYVVPLTNQSCYVDMANDAQLDSLAGSNTHKMLPWIQKTEQEYWIFTGV